MYLIKGLLIFSPVFFSRLPLSGWTGTRQKIGTSLIILIALTIILSPISFIDWLADYITFFIGATLTFKVVQANWTRIQLVITYVTAIFLFMGYVFFGSLFGPRLIDKYEKGGLTFKLYQIPDMVAAPTHKLKVDRALGIFEIKLYDGQVYRTDCQFDFNLTTKELITEDKCK